MVCQVSYRQKKALPFLDALIGQASSVITCIGSKITMPNPKIVLAGMEAEGWRWQEGDLACGVSTFGHGDFHVGNLMVDLSEDGTLVLDGLTVLDYDYVGEYCQHYDRAQLESSFLMELALAFDDQCGAGRWDEYFLPALKVLTSADSEAVIENNKFAYDLVSVVRTLRGDLAGGDLRLYYGALFTTLLRISVSKYRKADQTIANLPMSARRTTVVAMGLLLSQLAAAPRPLKDMNTTEVAF